MINHKTGHFFPWHHLVDTVKRLNIHIIIISVNSGAYKGNYLLYIEDLPLVQKSLFLPFS